MVILGAVVNGICIIFGTLLGKLFSRIPESMKGTIMHAIGLAVTVLGLQMALKSENFLVVILSLVIGTVIGEWLQLEGKLKQLGDWLENKVGSKGKGSISEGFVTATLIFAIGAMGILGALDSGIRGNHDYFIYEGDYRRIYFYYINDNSRDWRSIFSDSSHFI